MSGDRGLTRTSGALARELDQWDDFKTMVRIHFQGVGGSPGPWIDADYAIERGGQILMVVDGIQGTLAVRTVQDTVAVVAGPLAGSQWTDAWIEEAGSRAGPPAHGPAGPPSRSYSAAELAGIEAWKKSEQARMQLYVRLTAGAILAVFITSLLHNFRPDDVVVALLLNPGGLVFLASTVLLAGTWPHWWPGTSRFVRRRLFTGA